MRVYIAGPLTQGDEVTNVKNALDVASELMELGYQPYVPHVHYFWDTYYKFDYERWMQLETSWLTQAHALVRLPGTSPGSDREVELAGERGIPVYSGVASLLDATYPPDAQGAEARHG